ncbi:MAG: hypothetical protein IJP68_10000 [Selenomonadaceae bacterium]|nr:hypothetical protein [Selenomonadaceae bacterium]
MTKQEKRRERDRRRHENAKPAYEALMSCYPFTLEDLDGEQWRPIEGFAGYEVSTFGRVKSFKYKTPRILKPHLIGDYLNVPLRINGTPKGPLIQNGRKTRSRQNQRRREHPLYSRKPRQPHV